MPYLPASRSTSWLFGVVLALFVTGVFSTVLGAADTTWPDAHQPRLINVAVPRALAAKVPALFVQGGLAAPVGSLVDVPLALDTAGAHVAALSFSLDYDTTCFALATDDQDRNGLPDAIVFDVPSQFRASVSVNPGGQPGRLDVMLIDYIPPLAALRATAALITIQFRIICPLTPGLIDYADVRFATTPAVGFSDNDGRDLPGVTRDGFVQVIGAIPTATPTPTPTPTLAAGSPTPTPLATASSTPPPAPVVLIEILVSPDRLTRADRGVILILDYVLLTAANNILLTIPIPQHTYFDATASSLGWQCDSAVVNRACHFPLYETTRHNSMSGRVFFAVALNWPLPAHVTQIELTTIITVNGEPSNQVQSVILPVLATDATPQPGALTLDLHTNTLEMVVGLDHELTYMLTYTNSSQTVLYAVEFHLVLPTAATLRLPADVPFDWACWLVTAGQPECTFAVRELKVDAKGQVQFVLDWEPPSNLVAMSAVVLFVYAAQEGKILSSNSSVVPIRQSVEGDQERVRLFLPLIFNEPNIVVP